MSFESMSSGALCCGSGPDSPDDSDDFLLIGLQGSGKTLLGQRLRTVHAKAPTSLRISTTETNGSQDFRVPTPKGCPFKEIRIRECGGSMQPLWHNWYSQPLKGVLFALDVSDPPSLAAAGLELHRVMQHPDLLPKPVCLLLTKTDLPFITSREQLDIALGLSDLQELFPGRLRVSAVSSVRGAEECPELRALLEWMVQVKASPGVEGGSGAASRRKR